MAEKLTPAKVEEAVKHYENIQSGKTPILKTDKEKTNLQREQESSIMEYKNKFT